MKTIGDNIQRQRPKSAGPFTIFKKFGNIESLSSLGDDVKGAIERGLSDPKFGLELDHGRAILRIELEVVVDPASVPKQTNFQLSVDVPGLNGDNTAMPVSEATQGIFSKGGRASSMTTLPIVEGNVS